MLPDPCLVQVSLHLVKHRSDEGEELHEAGFAGRVTRWVSIQHRGLHLA